MSIKTPRELLHETLQRSADEVERWTPQMRQAVSMEGIFHIPDNKSERARILDSLTEMSQEFSEYEEIPDDMKIIKKVCLCGSTRFYDEFQKANAEETLAGNIVLTVGCYKDQQITEDQKIKLDELHKRKIDLADEILVLNRDGYIGESTKSEIEYAELNNKTVRYYFDRTEIRRDEMRHFIGDVIYAAFGGDSKYINGIKVGFCREDNTYYFSFDYFIPINYQLIYEISDLFKTNSIVFCPITGDLGCVHVSISEMEEDFTLLDRKDSIIDYLSGIRKQFIKDDNSNNSLSDTILFFVKNGINTISSIIDILNTDEAIKDEELIKQIIRQLIDNKKLELGVSMELKIPKA